MRAVMLEVDQRLIAERQRLGLDTRDEMWEGVLHMVPPASRRHQKIEAELLVALIPITKTLGLEITPETGVFGAHDDYKVPDVVLYDISAASERGVDGAPRVVIEIRSPRDETNDKIPWYLARGTLAVLVVDRDTLGLELHTADGRVEPDADGGLFLAPLGVHIRPAGTTLAVGDALLDL